MSDVTPDSDLVWNRACETVAALDRSDPDAGGLLEEEANQRFYALVPDDDTLVQAFEAHLRAHPEAYAPTRACV